MRSSVSKEVKSAVDAVFGEACYYNGDYINAVSYTHLTLPTNSLV